MKDERETRGSLSSFILPPSALDSLALHLVQGVPPEARAILLQLNLLYAAGHLYFRTVVQVAGFGALEPDHLAVLFCHGSTRKAKKPVASSQKPVAGREKGAFTP